MKINEQWEALKEESHANIQSEKGDFEPADPFPSVTEGHLDIKENMSRRFQLPTAESI